jgi:signal transduction histidine kinase
LTIYGVTSLKAAQQVEHHLRQVLGVGLALLVVLAAVLIWWVVGRALAPVDAMREVVDRIQASDLDERVEIVKQNDEISRLGITLNRMLARLQEASSRQRLFAAAASHELRSPLSAIRTELEVGLTYPDQTDWKVVANESLIEVERLEHLARDLAQLTRLHANVPVVRAEPCDLALLVEAELGRRGVPTGVVHRAELRPVTIVAPKDSVIRVLRNLLDNAERHAATEIVVATGIIADPPTAQLLVGNDGPPVPDAEWERIFDPFTRLDDARDLDEGGTGLGLAIARGLVESLGGTLSVAAVATGAAFEANFPLSQLGLGTSSSTTSDMQR